MAYVLKPDVQRQIIHLLVEGNSIRSTERLTGVHRDTIIRLMVRTGERCRQFLDRKVRRLKLRHVQADEIWTFVGRKQATLGDDPRQAADTELGDQFLFVALDTDTKLIASFLIGKRTSENARAFTLDLAGRIVTECPQLSTEAGRATPRRSKRRSGGT